ncbi:hypothetical protein H7142_00035 [Candidatus Saccharibacteria bacterium]|nr:hypothetical protein [Candidatus Saccharibacteria bacterium]
MEKTDKALRKRQQISSANRMMFIWVAAGSGVVGIALVVSIFLVQQLWFNEKVLNKKNETVSSLDKSLKAVDPLRKEIAVLNTNQTLLDNRAKESDKALQAIIDALPDSPNTAAFGASLQNVLIPGQGIQLETLSVDPMGADSEGSPIEFSFSVSTARASINELRNLQQRLERSIRAIKVTSVLVESSASKATMSVKGEAYYEPSKKVELGTESVKP